MTARTAQRCRVMAFPRKTDNAMTTPMPTVKPLYRRQCPDSSVFFFNDAPTTESNQSSPVSSSTSFGDVPRWVGRDGSPVGSSALERQYRDGRRRDGPCEQWEKGNDRGEPYVVCRRRLGLGKAPC